MKEFGFDGSQMAGADQITLFRSLARSLYTTIHSLWKILKYIYNGKGLKIRGIFQMNCAADE